MLLMQRMMTKFMHTNIQMGCYKVIEVILIEFHFDYFDINPIEIFTSITILLIRIELKYLVNFDANNVDLNRNEILFFQISWEGENE